MDNSVLGKIAYQEQPYLPTGTVPPKCREKDARPYYNRAGYYDPMAGVFNSTLLDSALANQAAEGRPVTNSSNASRGHCTHCGSVVEFIQYRARQR
jgi:hypothetical protein